MNRCAQLGLTIYWKGEQHDEEVLYRGEPMGDVQERV